MKRPDGSSASCATDSMRPLRQLRRPPQLLKKNIGGGRRHLNASPIGNHKRRLAQQVKLGGVRSTVERVACHHDFFRSAWRNLDVVAADVFIGALAAYCARWRSNSNLGGSAAARRLDLEAPGWACRPGGKSKRRHRRRASRQASTSSSRAEALLAITVAGGDLDLLRHPGMNKHRRPWQ